MSEIMVAAALVITMGVASAEIIADYEDRRPISTEAVSVSAAKLIGTSVQHLLRGALFLAHFVAHEESNFLSHSVALRRPPGADGGGKCSFH